MPFNLGFGEILVILVIALLVFGGRLPEVGRSMGRSIREFKEGLKEAPSSIDDEDEDEEEKPGSYERAVPSSGGDDAAEDEE